MKLTWKNAGETVRYRYVGGEGLAKIHAARHFPGAGPAGAACGDYAYIEALTGPLSGRHDGVTWIHSDCLSPINEGDAP